MSTFVEADCQILLNCPVYRFFWFDVPNIWIDILDIWFSISLSLSQKTGYDDYKCVIPGISHEKLGLIKNV